MVLYRWNLQKTRRLVLWVFETPAGCSAFVRIEQPFDDERREPPCQPTEQCVTPEAGTDFSLCETVSLA